MFTIWKEGKKGNQEKSWTKMMIFMIIKMRKDEFFVEKKIGQNDSSDWWFTFSLYKLIPCNDIKNGIINSGKENVFLQIYDKTWLIVFMALIVNQRIALISRLKSLKL